jgi:hypothetical protein
MVYTGLYISLYPSLRPEQIDKLEQAICALSLSRFNEAQAIYGDPVLQPSYNTPVVALQRSGVYSDQELARKSVDLLTEANNEIEDGGRVQDLIRIKMHQSRIIADGRLRDALEEARRVRGLLVNHPLEEYTDIDVSHLQQFVSFKASNKIDSEIC